MRALVLAGVLLAGAGCGRFEREVANLAGYAKSCVEGVTYVQFPSGAALLVDRSGRPVPCE